ncbi:MAG: 3-dehydroquinate synthase [Gammaproteobacteria bacterium]|nr:3-dehydroquinate synthase [Gammaproteobacteria bacterium]
MKTVNVNLALHSYPIHIGPGVLGRADLMRPHLRGQHIMVVTNEIVAPLYLERVVSTLSGFDVHTKILADGESQKNLDVLNSIFDGLLAVPCDRQTTLMALGGGVVGDITGFAAACYLRGVSYAQLPTTLLAQVDSSVGGKTAVNHRLGKNLIGAFHQPSFVIADTDVLNTLSEREFAAGLAEVIKYGLIQDRDFFQWLQCNIDRLLHRDEPTLVHAIERCCINKASVVAQDEREVTGTRAVLNFGHTFGHAIETRLGYGKWLHGEAVSAGMMMAAHLSNRLQWLEQEELRAIEDLLSRAGLPTKPPSEISVQDFLQFMSVDKKIQSGKLRLVLLRGLGNAVVTEDYPPALLHATLAADSRPK